MEYKVMRVIKETVKTIGIMGIGAFLVIGIEYGFHGIVVAGMIMTCMVAVGTHYGFKVEDQEVED